MLENYPDAETILVTGSSAGSIPSPFYGAQASLDYPTAKIMVFNDGSGGLYTNNTYDFYDIWNLADTTLDFPQSSTVPDRIVESPAKSKCPKWLKMFRNHHFEAAIEFVRPQNVS